MSSTAFNISLHLLSFHYDLVQHMVNPQELHLDGCSPSRFRPVPCSEPEPMTMLRLLCYLFLAQKESLTHLDDKAFREDLYADENEGFSLPCIQRAFPMDAYGHIRLEDAIKQGTPLTLLEGMESILKDITHDWISIAELELLDYCVTVDNIWNRAFKRNSCYRLILESDFTYEKRKDERIVLDTRQSKAQKNHMKILLRDYKKWKKMQEMFWIANKE